MIYVTKQVYLYFCNTFIHLCQFWPFLRAKKVSENTEHYSGRTIKKCLNAYSCIFLRFINVLHNQGPHRQCLKLNKCSRYMYVYILSSRIMKEKDMDINNYVSLRACVFNAFSTLRGLFCRENKSISGIFFIHYNNNIFS